MNKKITKFLDIIFTEVEPFIFEEIKSNTGFVDKYSKFKSIPDRNIQVNLFATFLNRIVFGSELIYNFLENLLETPRNNFYEKFELLSNEYLFDLEKKIEQTEKLLNQIEKYQTNTTVVADENDLLIQHFEELTKVLVVAKSQLDSIRKDMETYRNSFIKIQKSINPEVRVALVPYFKTFMLEITENGKKRKEEIEQMKQQ